MKSIVIMRLIATDERKRSIGPEEEFRKGPKALARARHLTTLRHILAIRRCRRGDRFAAVGAFPFEHYRAPVSAASAKRFISVAAIPMFTRDET
jgi:hypothetical protein